MKTMTIELPLVTQCKISECAYNVGDNCHARAITIGDGVHPGCDTYFKGKSHIHKAERTAGIGACKVAGCKFNDDLECMTDAVKVGMVKNQVSCMTYMAR